MNFASPEPSAPDPRPEASVPRSPFVKRPVLALAVLCLLVIGGLTAVGWSWAMTRGDRIIPGVLVLETPIGGLTRSEADAVLQKVFRERWAEGVRVRAHNESFLLKNVDEFLRYDRGETLKGAYSLGREGSWRTRLTTPLLARLASYTVEPHVTLERDVLQTRLRRTLSSVLREGRDARLRIEMKAGEAPDIQIDEEQAGDSVDWEGFMETLRAAAKKKGNSPFTLAIQTTPPQLTKTDLEPLVPEAVAWLQWAPFTLTAEDRRFPISPAELAPWLRVNTSTRPVQLVLDEETARERLRVRAKDLLKPVQDGNIELDAEGKAKAFLAPEEGVDVDSEKTLAGILAARANGSSTTELVLTRVAPRILGDGERLGIQEMVGVGRSNFSGSPTNRRRNIALGAKKVGMTLVPPGEEFSMLKTLGVIDGEHGWLPELVIKGNKTTPEFGGGLCQVGTTMFRAALASGFPITERRNHSYRVRYYEPAGTDATIYDPAPDFKFKNDLEGWILITTRIQGDSLLFTVWGKKDGRTVAQTSPKVFNIVPAPPKKIVETLDLKPGEVKCTESEHAGADAQFDYTVTYPDGRVEKKTFFSRYRPWQAVCLKGVAELSAPPADSTASQPLTPDIPVP